MSKRLGPPFNSRIEAMVFVKENRIPITEVKRFDRNGRKPLYRIIVKDSVYKRWAYLKKRKNKQGRQT